MSLVSNNHELWEIQRKLQYDLHRAQAEGTSDVFVVCTVKSTPSLQFTVTPQHGRSEITQNQTLTHSAMLQVWGSGRGGGQAGTCRSP